MRETSTRRGVRRFALATRSDPARPDTHPRDPILDEDDVVVEEPLEIRIAGETVAITMRTPGADRELVLGFLLSEGVITGLDEVASIAPCGRPGDDGYGNAVDVVPAPGARLALERVEHVVQRGTITTSACGICGRRSIDDLVARVSPVVSDARVPLAHLVALGPRLLSSQPTFRRTGGLHAAGLATPAADGLGPVFEDVGRHNAVDKVVGSQLLARTLDAGWTTLVVSGRASFEIVQKAVVARIPIVVSVSAPSSLAIDLSLRANMTLVGFARDDRVNVYAGAQRIV
ncbi:MAG: formate dehydrogenase accessory sulfurtransferase FdhD [Deltaproteobacteria bacterium]|nr:formate dehydrogenase accessory sulfurtransferase FdhD [Deltaproteobacteria bacterium]